MLGIANLETNISNNNIYKPVNATAIDPSKKYLINMVENIELNDHVMRPLTTLKDLADV